MSVTYLERGGVSSMPSLVQMDPVVRGYVTIPSGGRIQNLPPAEGSEGHARVHQQVVNAQASEEQLVAPLETEEPVGFLQVEARLAGSASSSMTAYAGGSNAPRPYDPDRQAKNVRFVGEVFSECAQPPEAAHLTQLVTYETEEVQTTPASHTDVSVGGNEEGGGGDDDSEPASLTADSQVQKTRTQVRTDRREILEEQREGWSKDALKPRATHCPYFTTRKRRGDPLFVKTDEPLPPNVYQELCANIIYADEGGDEAVVTGIDNVMETLQGNVVKCVRSLRAMYAAVPGSGRTQQIIVDIEFLNRRLLDLFQQVQSTSLSNSLDSKLTCILSSIQQTSSWPY